MFGGLRTRFSAAALLALILMPGAYAYAQVVDNGCTDAAGVRHANCSRLNKGGDRVTIKATDCGNPDSTAASCQGFNPTAADENAAQCRTVYNNGTIDYFVPWKSPEEWGRFLDWAKTSGVAQGLSTHLCCSPLTGSVCANRIYNGTLIGPQGLPANDPVTGQPIQLGKRILGMRGGNLSDFGAQNDVSNTLDAAVLLGNSTINYKVTYVCNEGTWVKTFEEGSCTPLDGACGASVPVGGASPNLLTALQQQNLLCVDGSVMQNLTDHGTYWTWDCLGTPGRGNAACAVGNSTTSDGSAQCGTASFARLTSPPNTTAQLCAQGIPSAVTGVGTQASPWSWVCNGSAGAYESCIAYSNTAAIDGVCGTSNGEGTDDPNWDPGTGISLCGNGTQLKGAVNKASDGWNWSCAGENGGSDEPCSAALNSYIGICNWPAVDSTSGTTPPDPLVDVMCTRGTPSAIVYGPDYEGDGRMAWTWSCNGTANPPCNGSYDCICEKYDLNGAQPGICGGDNYSTHLASDPPSENLCGGNSTLASGPTWNASLLPPQWQWTCQGLNGGGTTACTTDNQPTDGICNYDTSNFTVTPFIPLPADACGLGLSAFNLNGAGAVYTYQCPGIFGGATASCAVSYEPNAIQGVCGYTVGQNINTGVAPPTNSLCSSGTVWNQHFNPIQDKRYEWQCLGSKNDYDKSCAIYIAAQPGVCGSAHNTQQSVAPTGSARCSYGTASAVAGPSPNWSWTCKGMTGTIKTPCNATYVAPPATSTDGVCGSANGSEGSTAPTSNLCGVGTPTSVVGNGPWTWSCTGLNGGTTAACIATLPAPTGPGQCGDADGTTIPSQPNTNLCISGNPGVVTGNGPWHWDCVGTSTVSCSANPCTLCSGDLAGVAKSATLPGQSISYGGGVCAVGGTVNWTQIDSLSGNNAAQTLTFSDSSSGTQYSTAALPAAAPSNYCPPCYRRAKNISGSFTVQKNGTCAGSTLNDGNAATINFGNVQITVP